MCKELSLHKQLWLLPITSINISMDLSTYQSVSRLYFHRDSSEIWPYWHVEERFSFQPSNKSDSHEGRLLRSKLNHEEAQIYITLKTANKSQPSTLRGEIYAHQQQKNWNNSDVQTKFATVVITCDSNLVTQTPIFQCNANFKVTNKSFPHFLRWIFKNKMNRCLFWQQLSSGVWCNLWHLFQCTHT